MNAELTRVVLSKAAMKLTVVCMVCKVVIRKGDDGAPISHSYCSVCAASAMEKIASYVPPQEV